MVDARNETLLIENETSLPKKGKKLFKKGDPGGPGRPKGSRNKDTVALEAYGTDRLTQIKEKMFDIALNGNKGSGDFNACRYIWEQLVGKNPKCDLGFIGDTKTPSELSALSELILKKTINGEISAQEAVDFSKALEHRLNVVRDVDIVAKIDKVIEKVEKL